jgi:hypothetical protein
MVRILAVALVVISVPSAAPGVAGIAVTMYLVIALPFDTGTVKVIVACPGPAVATTFVGDPGTRPESVMMFDVELPAALKATTR